jgi:hypothetical protein
VLGEPLAAESLVAFQASDLGVGLGDLAVDAMGRRFDEGVPVIPGERFFVGEALGGLDPAASFSPADARRGGPVFGGEALAVDVLVAAGGPPARRVGELSLAVFEIAAVGLKLGEGGPSADERSGAVGWGGSF